MDEKPTLAERGYYSVPEKSVAAVVTSLYRPLSDEPYPLPDWPRGLVIDKLEASSLSRAQQLIKKVGGYWLWWEFLARSHEETKTFLTERPTYALKDDEGDLGICTLSKTERYGRTFAYLDFFGLTRQATGQGLGKKLMAFAFHQAAKLSPEGLFVQTCSLDHPFALTFYCQCGFRPYQRSVETFPDPRLAGYLPDDISDYPFLHPLPFS